MFRWNLAAITPIICGLWVAVFGILSYAQPTPPAEALPLAYAHKCGWELASDLSFTGLALFCGLLIAHNNYVTRRFKELR